MSTFENIAEELKKLRQQQEDLARNLGVSFAPLTVGKTVKPNHPASQLKRFRSL